MATEYGYINDILILLVVSLAVVRSIPGRSLSSGWCSCCLPLVWSSPFPN